MPLHCLARIRPLHKATGTRIDIHVSSASLRQITGLNGVVWEPAMVAAPVLNMRLFNGDFQAAVEPGSASLPINMTALKQSYPTADACAWSAAPVDIWAGEAGQAWPWTQVFSGKVSGWNRRGQVLSLSAETAFDDKNVLTGTYAGTGGAEGSLDLKGKVKPLALGWPQNVEPVLINAVDSVYQFSAYGPIEAVTKLYERGSDFGASIGDYANYTALVAASIPPGRWATCLAQGMIRLGAPAFGVITGDLKGHKVGASAPRLTGAIINALATISGTSSAFIESASLTALDAAAPYPVSAMITDQVKFSDAAKGLALPCNWQAGISLLGKFFVMPVTLAGSPALTLDSRGRSLPQVIESAEQDVSPPYFKTILGAAQSWRVHTADEISFTASLILRGEYVPGEAYREGHIVTSADGSAWLYVNPVASSGNAPPSWPTTSNAYWENHTPPLSSTALKYGDGTPIESLKPAQVGATVGAISGVNLRNNADTAYLGDPDIITAAGTAAAIAGQGPLATAPSASPYVNANITIGANGALSGAGGGTVTISGLGYTGALNATFGARVGTNLRNSSDTAYLGDADVITSAGTAAAIAGQGSLATKSTVTYGTGDVTGFGAMAARTKVSFNDGFIFRQDGTTAVTDAIAITSLGTAAAITGQGALATKSTAQWSTDLAGIPEDRIYDNILNLSQWAIGTSGTQGTFSQNGVSAENSVILGTGPFGTTEAVWRSVSDAGNNADGGWGCNFTYANFNPKRSLRMTVFAKRDILNGSVYIGCDTTGRTLNLSDSSVNSNPYFWNGTLPQINKWYLLVGVIHGSDYTGGQSGISGVYDVETGQKVVSGVDFKMSPTATLQTHRVYQYYTTQVVTTDFARPRVDILDASAPTLDNLMKTWARIGTNLLRASGNTIATENDILTSLGTAAAFTGQSAWATYSGLTPTNVAGQVSGLDTSGNLSSLTKVSDRKLTLLKRADGISDLTEAATITSLGTAAGIAGQGSLATKSTVTYGTADVSGFGAMAARTKVSLNDGFVFRQDGTTALTDALAVTSLGTAAAITGQGALATKSLVTPSLTNIGGTSNVILDTNFADPAYWVFSSYNPGAAVSISTDAAAVAALGSTRVLKFACQSGVLAGAAYPLAQANSNWTPVAGGQNYFVQISYYCSSAFTVGSCVFQLRCLRGDGSVTYPSKTIHGVLTAGASGVASGIVTLPSDAVAIQPNIQMAFAAGNDPAGTVYYAKPIVQPATAFGAGVVRADGLTQVTDALAITSLGTAAAITGQGSLATKSAVDLASAEVTNKSLANLDGTANTKLGGIEAGATVGGVFGTNLRETAGGTVASLSNFKTSLGTAAAITGQAATATSSDFASITGTTKPANNATNDRAVDTRNTNQLPSWYRTNYSLRTATEFKDGSAIGISVPAATYGTLTTVVDYSDSSGGSVKQRFVLGKDGGGFTAGQTWVRVGSTSNDTAWGAWQKDFSGFTKPTFGDSDILESSGTTATLANFKTSSGTAAAIAGQGYFATQNYAGASRLLTAGYDNIIPDADYRDPAWWGFSSLPNVGFLSMDSYWEQSRALSFTCDRDFDFYSSYFNIEPGATYRVRTRIWNNDAGAGWTGNFWALIHMPNVAWWSLKHGTSVNADVGGSANAIAAIGDTGVQEFYFRATSNTMRNIQFRFKSTARGSRVDLQVMISKVPQLGKDLIKSGTATKYLVSEIETGLGTAAAITGQGAGATANTLAQLDATAAAQLTTAYNGGVQSAAYGETIKRKIGSGGTLALSALVNCAAGGVSGSIRARIESRPYGGSWSTVATGAGSATGPSEPGGDSTSGTFTNSTGIEQVFEFRVIEVRTPSGAGGAILASQSYVTG